MMNQFNLIELRLPQIRNGAHHIHHFTKVTSSDHQEKLNHLQHLINTCNHPSTKSRIISLNSEIEKPPRQVILCDESESDQSVTQSSSEISYYLGEGALEHCIPPPYRTPKRSLEDDHSLTRHQSFSTKESQSSIQPWPNYQPLPCTDQAISYDLRSPQLSSTSRGFWLIPIWKRNLQSTDFYTFYHHQISLPYWTDHRILSSNDRIGKFDSKTIVWDPYRLNVFWKFMCMVCEKEKLGNVVTLAMVASHLDSLRPRSSNDQSEIKDDGLGDHIRIWCDVQSSLLVRRFISDISLKVAFQTDGFMEKHQLYDDEKSVNPFNKIHAGKWLKNCVFMWFDQTGIPRGYS